MAKPSPRSTASRPTDSSRRAPDPALLELELPAWLGELVAPWQLGAATLRRRGGVSVELRSAKARIPVLLESAGAGLSITILDERIAAGKGASFVRALSGRLGASARTRAWLRRASALARALTSEGEAAGDDLIGLWRAWPERERDPTDQVDALPGVDASALPRAVRAALIAYQIARGQLLDALSAWAALPEPGPGPRFIEHHLDAIALASLGRRDDASEALAAAARVADDAPSWLAIARAYETLALPEPAARAHEQVIARRGSAWDRLRLARVREQFSSDAIPRPDKRASIEEKVSYVRQVVKILDAAGRHDAMLVVVSELLDELGSAAPGELILRAAQLHLWRVEGQQARARLALLDDPSPAHRAHAALIAGALAVVEGEPAQGLARLDGAVAQLDGAARLEALLWRAEAKLALGRHEDALADVDEHIMLENSLVAYLLKLVIYAQTRPAQEFARSVESRTFLDGLVADVLPSLCEASALADARAQPSKFAAVGRALLDDMGGNRGATPTWCRRDADGRPALEPVRVRPSGREAAVDNLVRIRTEPPDVVLAGFDAVLDEYPTSPHPCTYRGELLIWLGRYDDALASFDEADARAPTRWSYVGRAAAYDLLGQAEQADDWTARGAEKFGELETATTHVYRGERLRKLEDRDAARADLEVALEVKARRIGARINLALVYAAQGESEGWTRAIERLRVDAPAFAFEAGVRAGEDLDAQRLAKMLELMVGNRSSFLHTMIDAQGQFRVIPAPSAWVAHARLCVALGRRELGRTLARRWLEAEA